MIHPDWRAPASVRAFVTTRDSGDVSTDKARRKLRALLPAEPAWLKQVHGKGVVEIPNSGLLEADAAVARKAKSVCAVLIADCMPVLLADEAGTTVAAAHAGWRGLAAGVLEATVETMGVPPQKLLAWLGPAIGPRVYEVGEDVRLALPNHHNAFSPTRPGHWLLDLYAVARRKLESTGLRQICGGGFCTYSQSDRFFSYRRDRGSARMAAVIWLT
jgi:YfiH family protein